MSYKNYLKYKKRVFNSPLIVFTNFENGTFVNMVKLLKPYAGGKAYAVYVTIYKPIFTVKLFKTYDLAQTYFDEMVIEGAKFSGITTHGPTSNFNEKTKEQTDEDVLSDKQVEDYLRNPSRCPACGSDSIDADGVSVDGDSAWGDVKCNSCPATWRDVYQLTSIDNFQRNG